MRNDDWNEEDRPEPVAAPPAPVPAPAPPAPPAAPVAPEEGTRGAWRKVPFRVMLPIYLIAIVSLGLLCVMFFTVVLIAASR